MSAVGVIFSAGEEVFFWAFSGVVGGPKNLSATHCFVGCVSPVYLSITAGLPARRALSADLSPPAPVVPPAGLEPNYGPTSERKQPVAA